MANEPVMYESYNDGLEDLVTFSAMNIHYNRPLYLVDVGGMYEIRQEPVGIVEAIGLNGQPFE